jgi:hypothetical protein
MGKPATGSGLVSTPETPLMTPKGASITVPTPTSPTLVNTTPGGDGLTPPGEVPYKPKPYFDPTRFTNLAQFVNTMAGNKNILQNQLTAASKFPTLQTSPLVYMRTSTPNTIVAEQQNRVTNNVGKNIAESTTD